MNRRYNDDRINFVGAKRLTIIGIACLVLLVWLG